MNIDNVTDKNHIDVLEICRFQYQLADPIDKVIIVAKVALNLGNTCKDVIESHSKNGWPCKMIMHLARCVASE